jgi:hypothetical protein
MLASTYGWMDGRTNGRKLGWAGLGWADVQELRAERSVALAEQVGSTLKYTTLT